MQLECVMTWTASSKRVHYHSKSWLAHKCRPGVLAIVVLNIATWGWAVSAQSLLSVTAPPPPTPTSTPEPLPPRLSSQLCFHDTTRQRPGAAVLGEARKEKRKKTPDISEIRWWPPSTLGKIWYEDKLALSKKSAADRCNAAGKKDTWEWKPDSVPCLVLRGATICLWFHSSPD